MTEEELNFKVTNILSLEFEEQMKIKEQLGGCVYLYNNNECPLISNNEWNSKLAGNCNYCLHNPSFLLLHPSECDNKELLLALNRR